MPSIAGLPSSDCRSLHLLKEQFIDAIKLQANDFNDKKITLYYFFIERMVSNNRKIGFKSIQENIDTTTSGGKLVFHIFGALAEFERDIIRERTNAGLTAARARGRLGGRPKAKSLNTPKKVATAQELYNNKKITIDEICKMLNISRATLYRYIKVA